ncbi:D-alanyl-D-alanine carboxypeptidase [Streptomyces sp. NPDC006372]|uniref:D-alanyl-D-alanine carboxypeptidase n=1 Tax=Streptomyces sp. NPDC006372 TaxID=3155599 RepID=UPI00339FAD79
MAGESPDRSKQRESSAERTSGSASPVPEARSESADPRLAMAREAKRSSARGGVDTATRVLSVRTDEGPEDTERDESDSGAEEAVTDAGKDEGAGESSGSGERSEGESDSAAGDGRLRDAVAAWVASADEPAGTEDQDADSEDAEKDSADAGKPGKADAEEAEEADSEDDSADAETATEDDQQTEDADKPAAQAGKVAEDDTAEDADKPLVGDGKRAEDDKAEDPDEPVTQADKHTKDDEAEDADKAAVGDEKRAEGGQEADESADEPSDAPEGGQKAVEAAAEGSQSSDEADEEAEEREADRSATDTDESETETDSPASDAGPKADADDDKATKPADPRTADDTKADAAPKADTDTDDTTTDSDESDADAEGDDDKADSKPPVDQPTAVFKAVRQPVDQPTTMLKLGGVAKDVKGAEEAPERESERTSKFVALKPLDDPSTRKPASTGQTDQTDRTAKSAQSTPAAPAAPAAPADATAPVPTVGPERTTQQPLPPKPPLDLLAELTNTPPPPDTPLRTAVRRVKIWTPLALLLVVLLAVVQSVRPLPAPTLELTAEDSYTFEGGKPDIPWPDKGQAALDVQGIGTFGSSGEQKPVPIASVAKVMTAYLILREHPLKSGAPGPKIEIDQAAEDQSDAGQESTVDVTKGDKITQREALESILIASANNIARLLARWDAGSEKSFVQKMNDAAKDLGMKNTTYTDPSGLNNTTVSTAVDQVKLAKAAMQQPAFREVAAMMSYVDYKGTKHDNWNRLVGYNDVTGIKTGTTTSALGNLVFSARKDVDGETRRVIGAVVRQPAGGPDNTILGAALHEGDQLIRAAQGALKSATILKKGDVVGYADDGLGGRTPVVVTEDVTAVGWAGLSVKLTFAPDELPHTAKAGAKVGTLTVGDGTTSAVKVPVALQKDLVEPGFADKLTRLG